MCLFLMQHHANQSQTTQLHSMCLFPITNHLNLSIKIISTILPLRSAALEESKTEIHVSLSAFIPTQRLHKSCVLFWRLFGHHFQAMPRRRSCNSLLERENHNGYNGAIQKVRFSLRAALTSAIISANDATSGFARTHAIDLRITPT